VRIRLKTLAAIGAAVAVAGAVQANPVSGQGTWETTLKARGINGDEVALNDASAAFVYDTVLNVTWLANFNAGAGSSFDDGFSGDGAMTWASALRWADNLSTGGFTDWRLPSVSPINGTTYQYNFANNGSTDYGYAKTGTGWGLASEWAHLYYVTLGNLGHCTPNDAAPISCLEQSGSGLSNTGPFSRMQLMYYWTGTEYFEPSSGLAWYFGAFLGSQAFAPGASFQYYAVAVRDGDVLRDVGLVPEPQSLVLALTALAGLVAALRRRDASRGRLG
jgi:hypothetical protein